MKLDTNIHNVSGHCWNRFQGQRSKVKLVTYIGRSVCFNGVARRQDLLVRFCIAVFLPRPTQPSIPLGSVNEYHLQLGRQRQVWFIALADKYEGCSGKLQDSLRMRIIPEAIPEWLRGVCNEALYKSTFTFSFCYLLRCTGSRPGCS